LLTVGISYLLENVFEIIKCIFVISTVLGSSILAFILDCIVVLAGFFFFGKSILLPL